MPPMPKKILKDELNDLQWLARHAEKKEDFQKVYNSWDRHVYNPFWKDWGWILLAHRARKLKLDKLEELCMDHVTFEGYKEFKR